MNTLWTFQLTNYLSRQQDRILNVCNCKNQHILIAVGDENLKTCR